jgi:hypothetical protein
MRFYSAISKIYNKNYDQWCAIGKPMGFFWIPKEKVGFFSSTNARNGLFFHYLFKFNELAALKEQPKNAGGQSGSKSGTEEKP